MSIIAKWKTKRAAKRYASAGLDTWLARHFGASETYSPAQIERAIRELKLDARYQAFAYARFLTVEDYDAWAERLSLTMDYHDAHALMDCYAPLRGRFDPIGINPYVFAGHNAHR